MLLVRDLGAIGTVSTVSKTKASQDVARKGLSLVEKNDTGSSSHPLVVELATRVINGISVRFLGSNV